LQALLVVLPLGFVFQALFGEAEALMIAIFAPEPGQFTANFPQPEPTVIHITDAFEQVEGSGQFRRNDGPESFSDLMAVSNGVQLGDLFEHGAEAIPPVFVPEPFFVAVMPPFGEITVIDGATAKFLSEHLAAWGQLVDPVENFRPGLAVQKAAVELFPDVVWQAGYFSYAAHTFPSPCHENETGGGTKAVQPLR